MLNNASGFRKVYIAAGYTDLRRGIDGLASIVKFNFQLDPYEKDILFLFCGRRSDRIKGLVWEGDGFLLLYKRLELGGFSWPRTKEEALEITPEQYRDFYKARRRQKYLYERSRENRDISIDMLTTEQFNGADILVSDGRDIEEQVAYKLLLDKLHSCLALLTEEERELIYALFFGEKTEREWSAETGIPQKTINNRKRKILLKLKALLEN